LCPSFFELTGGIPFYIQKLGLMTYQNALLKTLSFPQFQRMKQIADTLGKGAANISTSLQRMVKGMILEKTDNSYYIYDEVFRRWLLSKFQIS